MNLQQRIDLLEKLREYILSDNDTWLGINEKAHRENGWFIPEFIKLATVIISHRNFLRETKLEAWVEKLPDFRNKCLIPRNVGIVMAGNIPLVGFHDFLCVFMSGHRQTIKPSSKDEYC